MEEGTVYSSLCGSKNVKNVVLNIILNALNIVSSSLLSTAPVPRTGKLYIDIFSFEKIIIRLRGRARDNREKRFRCARAFQFATRDDSFSRPGSERNRLKNVRKRSVESLRETRICKFSCHYGAPSIERIKSRRARSFLILRFDHPPIRCRSIRSTGTSARAPKPCFRNGTGIKRSCLRARVYVRAYGGSSLPQSAPFSVSG